MALDHREVAVNARFRRVHELVPCVRFDSGIRADEIRVGSGQAHEVELRDG